ncbi:helix-turn-helix domain-containing protein [Rhodococcus sp. IEGM 1408]|uniref:helix-turn-helix domain-containing protein n=1 Tax=Rhodococcus sp. IEGM 1408 TaxID=3082220 RepID=UPI0029540600|nr:helix-turn-helix domain-containing protein [Rhodococcus sp. IEGM 1408]MDV8002766.1 helix-turn-helix domain-containing protein [Rhodococcus sp. IEGM 1408]
MQPPDTEEFRWMAAVGLYEGGMHAREVCRRFGINRLTLARWCDRIGFRATWPDPDRQPPVPFPAPDYARDCARDADACAYP